MPVLPLVGSTMTERPGTRVPACSAASTMARAMRSLTEPPGLYCSHLTQTSAAWLDTTFFRRIKGVRPMRSSREWALSSWREAGTSLDNVHRLTQACSGDAQLGAAFDQIGNR